MKQFPLLSLVTSLISVFSHLSWSYKNCIIHQLQNIVFKIIFSFVVSFAFISMYGFNQTYLLNLIALSNFCNINLWFNACFKVLMCTTSTFLSYKLHASFSHFSIIILFGKNGKPLCSSCSFWGYLASTHPI